MPAITASWNWIKRVIWLMSVFYFREEMGESMRMDLPVHAIVKTKPDPGR